MRVSSDRKRRRFRRFGGIKLSKATWGWVSILFVPQSALVGQYISSGVMNYWQVWETLSNGSSQYPWRWLVKETLSLILSMKPRSNLNSSHPESTQNYNLNSLMASTDMEFSTVSCDTWLKILREIMTNRCCICFLKTQIIHRRRHSRWSTWRHCQG